MKYDPVRHHRRSLRLRGYDYSKCGAYFVTICTQERQCLFGDIDDGQMILNKAGAVVQKIWNGMTDRFGHLIMDESVIMPNHFHGVIVIGESNVGAPLVGAQDLKDCAKDLPLTSNIDEQYHFKTFTDSRAPTRGAPTGGSSNMTTILPTLGKIVGAFKSITTTEYIRGVKRLGWDAFPGKLWQRNFYERVIRDDDELETIREYINNNPYTWGEDQENPNYTGSCQQKNAADGKSTADFDVKCCNKYLI